MFLEGWEFLQFAFANLSLVLGEDEWGFLLCVVPQILLNPSLPPVG